MKIKIKDEMEDIRLTLKHRELVLIKEALEHININSLYKINNKLFDCQEYNNLTEIFRDAIDMHSKIEKKLDKIDVW